VEAEAGAEGGGWGCVEEGLESGNGEGREKWMGWVGFARLVAERKLGTRAFLSLSFLHLFPLTSVLVSPSVTPFYVSYSFCSVFFNCLCIFFFKNYICICFV